jgi:pimeloyl-ACP methyl ester carboxylesterase
MPAYFADQTQSDSLKGMAESFLAGTEGELVCVGHSMGGRVCMEAARLAPKRILGLVLADTGYDSPGEGERAKRQAVIDLGHRSMPLLVDKWLPPMVHEPRRTDANLMSGLRNMALAYDAETHERQIRALLDRPDAGAYLNAIHCPVLLITGRHDAWSPVQQHEEMAAQLPDSEFRIIEDAGHFAPLEQPEQVAEIVVEWLDRRIRPQAKNQWSG